MDTDTQKLEILLKLFDRCDSERHYHETARSTISTCLLTAYTALLTIVFTHPEYQRQMVFIIFILSLIGTLATLAHSQRYVFYWRRSQVIRDFVDENYTQGGISKLYDDAKAYRPKTIEEYKWPHKWLFIFSHHHMWMWIHFLVWLASLVFLLTTLCCKCGC